MARSSGNSLLNSLRGKIWISTSVLAFFICTFGLISYLVVTLLTNNPFYGVFIPFLFLAFTVIVFGWWLSNELVNPIENITLLAKSLERNSSTSLPKSSGSSETDQLLVTLQRNSQQMQHVVTLMDKVANGDLDVALTPLKNSDRLSNSFQMLLAKVSESIHAKDDLTKLKNEIEQVKRQIISVKNGNLDNEVTSDHIQTKEIAETINYLMKNLTLLISTIKVDSQQAKKIADNIEEEINYLIQQDENKIREINQASIVLKQVPNLIHKISDDLMSSAKSAKQTIDKARYGNEIAHQNSEVVGNLRSKLRKAVNRIQNLNERSQEIAKVAKTVEDLANRTNMIALNASIQASEMGEDGRSFVVFSEELERLAARANGTNKQISMLNSSILSEIGKVEKSLDTTTGEVAELSKFAIETGNILGELERYIGQYLNLQNNLIAFSEDNSDETDKAFETFGSYISDTENSIKHLTANSNQIKNISVLMNQMELQTSEFRVTLKYTSDEQSEFKQQPSENENKSLETDSNLTTKEDQLYKEFASQEFNKDDQKSTNQKSDEPDLLLSTADNDTTEHIVSSEFATDKLNSEKLQSNESDTQEFASDDLKLLEFDSPESDTAEFDSGDYDSGEFALDEFASDEFTSDELNLQSTESKENDSDVSDSGNFNSADYFDDDLIAKSYRMVEFLEDDSEITELKPESDQVLESDTSVVENILDDEDLLSINIDSNPEDIPKPVA